MGSDTSLQCSHCLVHHSFPWCSLGTRGAAFPRQCPGLCWGECMARTITTGTLDVDTIICAGRESSPMEARQAALLGLSTRALFLACSLSKHSQQDEQQKGLKHNQSLLNQWTGKTVSDLPLGNETKIQEPSNQDPGP